MAIINNCMYITAALLLWPGHLSGQTLKWDEQSSYNKHELLHGKDMFLIKGTADWTNADKDVAQVVSIQKQSKGKTDLVDYCLVHLDECESSTSDCYCELVQENIYNIIVNKTAYHADSEAELSMIATHLNDKDHVQSQTVTLPRIYDPAFDIYLNGEVMPTKKSWSAKLPANITCCCVDAPKSCTATIRVNDREVVSAEHCAIYMLEFPHLVALTFAISFSGYEKKSDEEVVFFPKLNLEQLNDGQFWSVIKKVIIALAVIVFIAIASVILNIVNIYKTRSAIKKVQNKLDNLELDKIHSYQDKPSQSVPQQEQDSIDKRKTNIVKALRHQKKTGSIVPTKLTVRYNTEETEMA